VSNGFKSALTNLCVTFVRKFSISRLVKSKLNSMEKQLMTILSHPSKKIIQIPTILAFNEIPTNELYVIT